MTAAAKNHPPREFLQAFGLGHLGDVAAAKVSMHLESCPDCQRQVAELSSDSLLDHLRQANEPMSTPAPSETLAPQAPIQKPATPPGPNLPPELLNNPQYEIIRQLGAGGMGVVYLAKNKLMDRLEVLKVINASMMHKSGALDRFLREIRSAAALSHDNVVKAYSALQFGELLVFAMEYVEGDDLAKVLKSQGQMPIVNACFYARQVALGLQHAHEKNMVHRDIKPHNLILARDGKKHIVKILDFGLAKATSEKKLDRDLTGEGRMLGTPDYMAPEQIQDAAKADIRADIYSLGCTLYYFLTGATPFSANSLYGLLQAHQTQEARSVNLVRPEVPMELGAIVAKMMAKDPAKRYQKPIEVAQALAPFLVKGKAIEPPPTPALSIGEPVKATPAPPIVAPKPVGAIAPIPIAKLAPPTSTMVASPFSFPPDGEPLSLTPSAANAKTPHRAKPPWVVSVAAGTVFLALLLLLGSILLRVESKDGTLIIKSDDPNAVVKVTPEGGATLTYGKESREIQLKPGKYGIELADTKSGLKLSATQVTLPSGGEKTVEISWQKKLDAPDQVAKALQPDRKAATYVLSVGGRVRVNDEERDINAVGDLPAEAFRLTHALMFDNLKADDTGLAAFAGCENLTVFALRASKVGDAGLSYLKDCKRLKTLDLRYTMVSDQGLRSFAGNKDLTELVLDDTRVGDAGMIYFKECKDLVYLGLQHSNVTDAGLSHFKGCTKLKFLRLLRVKLTDSGLANFSDCKELVGVDLIATQVTDAGLAHLNFKNTDFVFLNDTKVSDKGLINFKDCKKLGGLELWRTNVTAAGIAELQKVLPKCRIFPNAGELALSNLDRANIPPEALALAGDGDPNRAPATLVGVLGEVQPIHTEWVMSVAFSPDGRWLASASADRTIMLRDTATGRVHRILKGHTGWVAAVRFSNDGRTLVSAGHDGTLRLWSMDKEENPTVVEAKLGHPEIRTLDVSPDGRFVAAGGDSGRINLWKWGAWDKPIELAVLPDKVRIGSLAFSPDGELLACGSREEKAQPAQVRVYATPDGSLKGSMSFSPLNQNERGAVFGLSFSHDGKQLAATGGDAHGRVWEVASGKLIREIVWPGIEGEYQHHAGAVVWSPDDKTLAVAANWRIIVFDLPSGARRTFWIGLDQSNPRIPCLTFSPRGNMFAAGGTFGDVSVWDTATWKRKYLEHGHRQHVYSVACSPNGQELVSLGNEPALLRWQFVGPREAVEYNFGFHEQVVPTPYILSYNPDGKTFIVAGHTQITVGSAVAKETAIPTVPIFLQDPAISPDGRLVAGAGHDGFVHLWDLSVGRESHRLPASFGGGSRGSAFSREGKLLALCAEYKKRVSIVNVVTGAEVCSWEVKSPTSAAAFDPQSKILATGHDDGSVLLWDAATGQLQRTLAGHSAPIRSLKFTPDGKILVSSGNDGIIRMWNPENVRAREVIPLGPANRPLTFDLDPSGKYLFAAGHFPVIFVLRLP